MLQHIREESTQPPGNIWLGDSQEGPRGWAHPLAPQTSSPPLTDSWRRPEQGGPKPNTQGSVSPCLRLPAVLVVFKVPPQPFWSHVLLRSPCSLPTLQSNGTICSSPKIKALFSGLRRVQNGKEFIVLDKINNKSILEIVIRRLWLFCLFIVYLLEL